MCVCMCACAIAYIWNIALLKLCSCILILGLTGLVFRIILGRFGDIRIFKRILLYVTFCFVSGCSLMAMALAEDYYQFVILAVIISIASGNPYRMCDITP